MKSFHILPSAHACTELIVETNQLRRYMEENEYTEISKKEDADVVLVATCAFNQEFEDESYTNIETSLKVKKDNAKILVSGCFPKIAPKSYKSFNDIDAIPPLNMEKIEELVPPKVKFKDIKTNTVHINEYLKCRKFLLGLRAKNFFQAIENTIPFFQVPSFLDSLPMPDWYFIQGANGCLGKCTFCAIKHSRGGVKSNSIESIIPQVEQAVRRGYKTVSLAATDMGCWGQDLGMNASDLLKEIIKVKGDFKIDMHYFEPDWLIKNMSDLEPVFQTGKIKSFGCPVQSGSDKLLKLMGRNYEIKDFIDAVNFVVGKTKVKSINSILMLGFPGETVDDYMDSYNLVDKTLVSYWCVLKYEGRHNIKSETFDNKVPEHIQLNRRDRLETRTVLRNNAKLPDFIIDPILKMKFGKIV